MNKLNYPFIEALIAQDKLKQAIVCLLEFMENGAENRIAVLLLSRDLHGLEKMELLGVVEWKDHQRERSNIARKLLALMIDFHSIKPSES